MNTVKNFTFSIPCIMIHLLQCDQHNYSNVFTRTCYGMTVIVTKAVNVRTIWTNKMHYFVLVYFNNKLYMFRAGLLLIISRTNSVYKQHVEAYYWKKLVENSASCWFISYGYITMHCQQNLYKNCAIVGQIVPTAVNIRLPQNVGNVWTSFS